MAKPALFGNEVTLVQPPQPVVEGQKLSPADAYRAGMLKTQEKLFRLLPIAKVELTADQQVAVQAYQMAQLLLGAAAAAPMMCSEKCPQAFQASCPLVPMKKQPVGQRCPFEQQYVSERFMGWLTELGRTLDDLVESERATITTLVTLDLQERRCNMILSDAENAMLTSRAVRDVDAETGTPLCWEDVIHANAVRINEIITQRRMLLRDLELTPEMQTKRKRALGQLKGGGDGKDLATRQSENADKVRRALRGETIDV
jgi:hypothetical protein